jgi:hypothetical protein
MSAKVVARYVDGRLLKGISMDVDPNRRTFHIKPPADKAVQVDLGDLKALFFVRTLDGDPGHRETRTPDPSDPRGRGSTVVSLRFADGEEMVGLTIRYPPIRPFFFVVPVDPQSNNIRILVNRAAVVSMEALSTT